jgi:uncharacterized iron-regulated membrane protein
MIAPLFRRWHRWIAVPAGLVMLLIAVTGLILHVQLMQNPPQRGPGPPPGGPGMPAAPPSGDIAFHRFIMSLHTGDFLGPWGKYLFMLAGVALVFFAASGLWMYIDMFRRRLSQGRKGWFWN